MEKLILIIITIFTFTNANQLDTYCLDCHIKSKLPTKLIYKRYLMKYSTNKNMKEAIFSYLKNPKPKNSIMPKEFFLKFSPKNITKIEDDKLLNLIDDFLKKYDIRKRLK